MLIKNSEIITIHVPLNNETYHMIGKKQFEIFNKKSYLINTSRGDIIDSRYLLDGLKKNKLTGAALDVINDELIFLKKGKNDLVQFSKKNENLLITPHIGGATYESVKKTDLYIINQFINTFKKNI